MQQPQNTATTHSRHTATLIAIVAVAAGLAGYAAATQGPSIIHAFAATTQNTSTTTTSTNSTNQTCVNMGNGRQGMFIGSPPGQFGPPSGFPGFQGGFQGFQNSNLPNITSGTTISITSTSGEFRVFGAPTENGTASATLTFTVSSNLHGGYVLTLTSGTITINGTAYTVQTGTARMNPMANAISGQGTLTTSNGAFEIQARASGDFTGTTTAQATLDVNTGTAQYLVLLSGTIKG